MHSALLSHAAFMHAVTDSYAVPHPGARLSKHPRWLALGIAFFRVINGPSTVALSGVNTHCAQALFAVFHAVQLPPDWKQPP